MRYLLIAVLIFLLFHTKAQIVKDTIESDFSSNNIASLEQRISELEANLDRDINRLQKFQLGFSFGFNGYINGPKEYYIKKDSTLGGYGSSSGVSGMISALLGYKVKPKHTIYLNIPLSDLSPNENATLGIFNRRIAGGLGYGYSIGSLAIISVINIYPYEEPAFELLEDKKYDQEPLSVAELDSVPMVSKVSPSLTIGVCYNITHKGTIASTLIE